MPLGAASLGPEVVITLRYREEKSAAQARLGTLPPGGWNIKREIAARCGVAEWSPGPVSTCGGGARTGITLSRCGPWVANRMNDAGRVKSSVTGGQKLGLFADMNPFRWCSGSS
jgi:hypothetical protein